MSGQNAECLALLRMQKPFRDLSDAELRKVAALAEPREVPSGTLLSRQGDLGEAYFLIASGEAVVRRVDETGMERPMGIMGPGSAYGITSLFLGEPRDATVAAVSDMLVWIIRSEAFQDLLDRQPEIESHIRLPEELERKLAAPLFPWLVPQEVVAHATRRHWIYFGGTALWTTGLAAICGAILWFASLADLVSGPAPWLLATGMVWALALLWEWVDWRNDYLAVTTQRIVHHERIALLYEARHEIPLERVQNVNVRRDFLGSLLNYGHITVETAAEAQRLEFRQTPDPDQVREAIFEQLSRLKATKRATERYLIEETLAERLSPEISSLAKPRQEETIEHPESISYVGAAPGGAITSALRAVASAGILPRTRIETEEGITWRKHWIFLVAALFKPGLLLALAVGLAFLGSGTSLRYVALAMGFSALGWLWWQASDWANDLFIITDERIVDIEKRPLALSEERREASLAMIQNVSLEMPGILAATFNYGNVVIETAGAGEFTFTGVSNPREVQQEIFKRMEAFRRRQQQEETARLHGELAEWLTVYDKLRHGAQEPDQEGPGDSQVVQ